MGLLDFPSEILLHIFSYLDLPDLYQISSLNYPLLTTLTADPILHFQRRWIVSPSRVNHNLFGRSKEGHLFRPSVGELVRRGVIQGFGIERRCRMGMYIYSLDSISQYENGRALSRRHAQRVLSDQLSRMMRLFSLSGVARPTISVRNAKGTVYFEKASKSLTLTKFNPTPYFLSLHSTHVLPDIEMSSPSVARSLLPTMRSLKWCLQRDRLAREFKKCGRAEGGGLGVWLDGGGDEFADIVFDDGDPETKRLRQRVFLDGEKIRLAVCPDVKKRVGFYEKLCRGGKSRFELAI